MCAPLVAFLSAFVLHSVSAGGVYCAKTARDRAAALGLDYPGVHGAPDFHGPAHHVMHPSMMPLRPHPYRNNDPESDEIEPNTASHRQNSPGEISFNDRAHKHAGGPESTFLPSPDTYNRVQSEYTINQVLSFPRGQSVSNRKSNIEEVNHVAPPTWAEAPGRAGLVKWDPQGRSEPLSFVYNKHDLGGDVSVPNRRGMSLSGLPLPHSRGHGTYQRGLTGFDLGKEVPVLASSRFPNKGHVGVMTVQSPVFGRRRGMGLLGHLAQSLHRKLNVRPFAQGNPALRRLMKSKI